jgi:hypothetical protein
MAEFVLTWRLTIGYLTPPYLRRLRMRDGFGCVGLLIVRVDSDFSVFSGVAVWKLRALIAICILGLGFGDIHAQRVEFPTTPPPSTFAATPTYGGGLQPPPPTFDPYAVPSTTPSMGAPYVPPSAGTYGAPGAYSPYSAAPYSGSPPALYPEGTPLYTGQGFAPVGNAWNQTIRFMQEIHVDETWLSRGGGNQGLGINTINTWAAFAVPFFWSENPLLITPGFQLYLWDGPNSAPPGPPTLPTLPGQTYGAYLDFAWNPQINNWLGAELEVSPGVYTDFQHTTSQSIRILGRGLGVITFSPTMQFKLGIWYLDRLDIKLLPAGGIVWTPNPDARYEIFFPAPKLAHRCTTLGNHDLWAYIRGEYGGGSWTAELAPNNNNQFDYNDLRFAVGMDILPEAGGRLRGYLEVGYAWNRELVYRSGGTFNMSDTLLLGGGLSY